MRSLGVSLKYMYRGIHKVRASKGRGGEESVQKRASTVLVGPLLC